MKGYKIGACKIDITPPVGCMLVGHIARKEASKKIHDPLYLKCLSISDGKERIFIITSDLIEFPIDFVGSLKKEVRKKFGIHPSKILLTASHTHTGPFISEEILSAKVIPEYVSILKRKIIGCIIHCLNDEEEGVIKFGKGRVNIGIVNRRKRTEEGIKMLPNFDGPVDEELSVIKIERKDKSPKVIFFNYSCHPTTLSADIYEISADYPGVAQREIENFYKGTVAMFSNGCCGDVRPAIIDENTGRFKGGSFEDIERMGKILFSKVVEIIEKAEEIKGLKVNGISKFFDFKFEEKLIPKDEKELEKICDYYKKKFFIEIPKKWLKLMREKIRKKEEFPKTKKGELQVIRIGEVVILGIPGEVMVEIGLKLKEKEENRKLIICGYSNGIVGYIPTTEATEQGGYESLCFLFSFTNMPAPFKRNTEEELINTLLELINK
ncbi:MAG: neutral/alkaline non-lysosomal ceramidase N-terminal domain-containing protein [Candidatus Omnitrophica bacterium]|nr:neutral/alkaline non-lysosomal ceramidase N-terminal domain-containing protein [Candidatus Omnitrophota bacterium]